MERLLEGFAFLTGRLRQKLDDELPEITHALFNLLWPNYLRPLPACSVIQFTPPGSLSKSAFIAKETLVQSDPVEGVACVFRTAYDTEILPIELADLSFVTRNGEAVLALRFRSAGITLDNVSFQRLRLFLTGETTIVHTLYHYLGPQTPLRAPVRHGPDAGRVSAGGPGPGQRAPCGFRSR